MSLLKKGFCAAAILVGALAATTGTPPAQAGGEHPQAFGYGRCSKCKCQRFEGVYRTCSNSGCGHSQYDHY